MIPVTEYKIFFDALLENLYLKIAVLTFFIDLSMLKKK